DETLAILKRYAGRLKVVSEPDGGQANAVNKGVRLSSSDIIGWLNSDDVYCHGSLAIVTKEFAQRPAVDVIYGDAHMIGANDEILGAYYTEPWNPERLPERCILCQPAVFMRRQVFERVGWLDESLHYCLDYEFWLRLAASGINFFYVPRILAGSRQHQATKTRSEERRVGKECR